jgi:hypothetical protein
MKHGSAPTTNINTADLRQNKAIIDHGSHGSIHVATLYNVDRGRLIHVELTELVRNMNERRFDSF